MRYVIALDAALRLSRERAMVPMRALNIRLLGDRVLQNFAWNFAERLGWDDTFSAEYVALTKLQADAFVTLDPDLARAAATLVPVASYDEMTGWRSSQPSP